MSEIKTCAICKHVAYWSGSPCYSDYTPGEDARVYCLREHKLPSLMYCEGNIFKELIQIGSACADFEVDKS